MPCPSSSLVCFRATLKQASAWFEPGRKLDFRYRRMTGLWLTESIAVSGFASGSVKSAWLCLWHVKYPASQYICISCQKLFLCHKPDMPLWDIDRGVYLSPLIDILLCLSDTGRTTRLGWNWFRAGFFFAGHYSCIDINLIIISSLSYLPSLSIYQKKCICHLRGVCPENRACGLVILKPPPEDSYSFHVSHMKGSVQGRYWPWRSDRIKILVNTVKCCCVRLVR